MQPQTNHFELADLIDYVRGTGPPERLDEMREHLESDGCDRCRKSAEMLAGAYGAARELAAVEVPDATVRRARAIFQPVRQDDWLSLPAIAAKLVQLTEPGMAVAGLRMSGPRRQFVYDAGPMRVRVDLLSDGQGGRFLVGTLTGNDAPGQTYDDCRVILMEGKRTLAHTRTSSFGELYLDLGNHRNVRLVILPFGEDHRIEIPVDD